MSDHEFEKQVQRKMDEFKLRPSSAVWTAVEQNIRQHKRRRFGFWWPLALVFLSVSVYVLYNIQQPDGEKLKLATKVKKNNTDVEAGDPSVRPSTNSTNNLSNTQNTTTTDNTSTPYNATTQNGTTTTANTNDISPATALTS